MLLFFFRATHKWVFLFGFTYVLTSHLVLGLYFDINIDTNFSLKNYHSSNIPFRISVNSTCSKQMGKGDLYQKRVYASTLE